MTPKCAFSFLDRALSLGAMAAFVLSIGMTASAQIPGRNVNMVSGRDWPGGDPFLQRQNEPSLAASTRNPLHLMGGSNDYRTVDLPGLTNDAETGDAWLSIYKSFDGGQRWSSTLLPGFPQDTSPEGLASPIKGYQAGADPVVRAGTSGLIYYNGLVFDRGDNGRSGIFLARFIDRNNKENGDPINYLGTSMVAQATGTAFLDKPWMAVDIPRGNSGFCRVGGAATTEDDDDNGRGGKVKRNGHKKLGREEDRRRANQPPDDGYEYVPAGAVYIAYSSITGSDATLRSEVFIKRSGDCGATWSAPIRVSSTADPINQGATIAIDPRNGHVYVTWRRFASASAPDSDAIMVARLPAGAGACDAPGRARGILRSGPPSQDMERIFEHRRRRSTPAQAAGLSEFDQGTSAFQFRTNAYPTMAVDGNGRLYLAWTERGFAAGRPDAVDGDSRILISTSTDGRTFTTPTVADETGQFGHQLMPSLALAGGKLMLAYYDLRDTKAQVFTRFISDADSTTGKRQTIDIRAAMGTLGAVPSFAPSVRVSDYLMGSRGPGSPLEQFQVNPPNLPMFKLGTVPFIGDYIDLSPAPAFVPTSGGGWAFNTLATSAVPIFHAAWTDNRDVRPPADLNWQNYAPPGTRAGSASLFDPTKSAPVCVAGNAGSRNQNVYTARIGGGLVVGAPGNAKQFSPTVQRGFVVFAQNQTTVTRTFRMTVLAQPPGGRASFEQFPLPPYTALSPAPKTFVDVRVPARSTASRTIYATSTDPKAQLSIDVAEVGAVGGSTVVGGLAGRVLLNPDIANPDIANPDIVNPDIVNPDIANVEVYNPDIANPDIANPDIANPDFANPDIANPDIANPDIANISVANPDIANPDIANPDIANPDIANPDIANPDIANPDIANGAISDVSWTVSNIGNTTSAFNANLFVANAALAGLKTQLIVYKTYQTPVVSPNGCEVKLETRNELLFNVVNPNLITSGQGLPDQNDPSEKNATLWLNPGEVGRVTLRVFDNNRADNITFTNLDGSTASIDPRLNPSTVVTAAISAQGVDILDPPGATEPPAVTTTGTNLFYLQQPTNTAPGAPIAPAVRVRLWDNTGAPLPGVLVAIALQNPPVGVVLSGTTTAVADVDGIATFANLSVNVPANGLRLRATGASAGVVAAGTSAPFDVAVAGGPVSLWRADVTALDSVGSNHGTLQGGASYTVGRIGPGFNFYNPVALPTPNQFVLVPDAPSLRITNQLTMSAWIYPAGPGRGGAEGGIIINKEWAYEMARFADGTIRWAFGNGVDSFLPQVSWGNSGSVAPLNTWTHVVVTYNLGVVTTFINGSLVNTTNLGFVNLGVGGYTLPNTLRIGGRELPAYPAFFDGRIDEVGIQNRALTPAEVQALYNAALPQVPVAVAISNVNAIFDGSPKPVTAVTTPSVPVSVIYNSSTTAPSAIGAYSVQAIVSQNGYVGSAVVTHKIASTLPVGGNGGVPYSVSCAPGVFGLGLKLRYGYGGNVVTGGQLNCRGGSYSATFGNVNVLDGVNELVCPTVQNMVGIFGRLDTGGFTALGVQCQLPAGGAILEVGPAFPSGTPFAPVTCPAGSAVTGLVGGVGAALDSMALVCAPVSSITSVSPAAQVAPGQMLTVNGVGLPASSLADVLFNQGGPDIPAQYMWGASSTLATVRLPALTVGVPTTIRLKNPASTISTNSFPITITSTPGTPVLTSLLNQCSGGTPISNLSPGSPFAMEGEGIDTSGTTFVWTPITASGTVLTQTGLTSTGGPTGRVCSYIPSGAPTLSPGTWSLQLRTNVGFSTSADSNAFVVTVP